MTLRSALMLLVAAGLLVLTGGPTSLAQMQPPQPQRQRGFFEMFWQIPQQPQVQPRQQRPVAPAARRRPPPMAVRDDPLIPKVDVRHHVLVMGDSLAALLAGGLDDALNNRPDVAVVRRARPDSGLVRADFYDWPKAVNEILAGDLPGSIGVMMLGLNDRQAIREGEMVHEPLSPRWTELYRQRIDQIAEAFAARRVPLIWVGAPPVQNGRLSADFVTFNELYREEVEKAGGQYVDLWGGFVDAENRYTAMGPDVSGQITRLRLGDGIHFTAAGARKAAHFVDVVIRRMIETQGPPGLVALPAPAEPGAPVSGDQPPVGVERLIDAMVGNSAALSLPSFPVKPVAGPILPLTGQVAAGEQGLLASIADARGRGDIQSQLDRIFGEGVPSEPKPGRMDDFRWPR